MAFYFIRSRHQHHLQSSFHHHHHLRHPFVSAVTKEVFNRLHNEMKTSDLKNLVVCMFKVLGKNNTRHWTTNYNKTTENSQLTGSHAQGTEYRFAYIP